MKTSLGMRATALLVLLGLKACGGGGADDHHPASGRTQAASGQPAALFASDGRPSAAAQQPPVGWSHRSRAGLYATPEQLAWEALTVEPYTVLVDVDAHPTPDAAIAKTLSDFSWSGGDQRLAFYVRAAQAQQAVAVADALSAAGVPLVFVVAKARS